MLRLRGEDTAWYDSSSSFLLGFVLPRHVLDCMLGRHHDHGQGVNHSVRLRLTASTQTFKGFKVHGKTARIYSKCGRTMDVCGMERFCFEDGSFESRLAVAFV